MNSCPSVVFLNLSSTMDTPQRSNQHLQPLPEDDLPKSWWNDDEVSYFFSPFRSHNQNPDDKDAKIKFWRPIIYKWCEHQRRCTFSLSELERTFTKNQLVPACLSGVVEDLLRKHQISEKSQFLQLPPQTWSGWAVDLLLKKPVGWSFKKAKELVFKTEEENVYVILEATKTLAELLVKRVKEASKSLLLTKAEVKKITSDLQDLDVILHWLLIHNKIVNANYKEEQLIKFCGDEEKLTPISETDFGIFALQQTESKLSQNLEELEVERLNAILSAKAYAAKGMKQMAKRSLKKKHEIEKNLDKRASVLENVQGLLSRIRESHSDSKILETYQQGIAALKLTLKKENLTDENVSNTMFELSEILDIHNEIQESMIQPIESSSDQELEDELQKLLLSEISPEPLDNIDLKDLPSVPLKNPPEAAATVRNNPSVPAGKAQISPVFITEN